MKKLLSKPRIMALVLFISILVSMNYAVLAQGRGSFETNRPNEWRKPPRRPPLSNIEHLADELGLTEDQLTSIKKERFKTAKESIELRSKIQIAQLELGKIIQSENPDEKAIKQKIEEMSGLRSNLKFTQIQSRLKMRNILTPEQLEKLKGLRKERFNKPKPIHRRILRETYPRQKFN